MAAVNDEIEIVRMINILLYHIWDPINIAGQAPNDEYMKYSFFIVSKISIDNSIPRITEILNALQQSEMGLPAKDNSELAKIIHYLYKGITGT